MARKATQPLDLEELELQATENWERACAHRDALRKEWEIRGKPLTDVNPNGIEYEHPLHKMLTVAERDVALRLKEIPKSRRPGRPAVGVPSSISESPASRRRRMKAV